jgi:hypothetical protein
VLRKRGESGTSTENLTQFSATQIESDMLTLCAGILIQIEQVVTKSDHSNSHLGEVGN